MDDLHIPCIFDIYHIGQSLFTSTSIDGFSKTYIGNEKYGGII